MIDGVVFRRQRTVTAIAFYFQHKTLENLFARLYAIEQAFAVERQTTRTFIDAKFRVNQLPVILHKPRRAIVITTFFVGGEGKNNVAVRFETFLFIANQISDKD